MEIMETPVITPELLDSWRQDYSKFAADELRIKTAFTEGKRSFALTNEIRPFVFSRWQRVVWEEDIKPCIDKGLPIRLMVLKERQAGASAFFAGLDYWVTTLFRNQGAFVLSHRQDSSENIFDKIRVFYKHGRVKPMYAKFNRREIHFTNPDPKDFRPGLESYIANNAVTDENVGASFSLSIVHFSEASRYENSGCNVNAIMEAIIPAVPDKAFTFIIFESTAEDGGAFFKEKYLNKNDTYTKRFLSWISDDTYRADYSGSDFELSKNDDSKFGNEVAEAANIEAEVRKWYPELTSTADVRHEIYCRLQWRRKKIYDTECHGDVNVFRRIYPTTPQDAFLGNVKGVFAPWVLSKQEEAVLVAQQRETFVHIKRGFSPLGCSFEKEKWSEHCLIDRILDRGYLNVFEKPIEGIEYYLGADPSLGIEDGDKSGLVVLRGTIPLTEVATFNFAIRPDEFAILLYAVGSWYNFGLIGVETNSMGYTTFDKLLRDFSYPRIYQRPKIGTTFYNELSENFGWYTEDRTKHQMITDMRAALINGEIIFKSLETIREHMQYQKMQNSRLGIPDGTVKGKSANLVMAACIALQMSKHGRVNLANPTTITPGKWTPEWARKIIDEANRPNPFKSRPILRRQ